MQKYSKPGLSIQTQAPDIGRVEDNALYALRDYIVIDVVTCPLLKYKSDGRTTREVRTVRALIIVPIIAQRV